MGENPAPADDGDCPLPWRGRRRRLTAVRKDKLATFTETLEVRYPKSFCYYSSYRKFGLDLRPEATVDLNSGSTLTPLKTGPHYVPRPHQARSARSLKEKDVSTQLARVEEMMQPNGSQVAILHRISNIVSSDLSLDKMLQELVELTLQVTDCDACLVYLADHRTGEIVLSASQLPHAAEI